MGVEFVRQEVKDMLDIYNTIDDCVAGEQQVKGRGTVYLPKPNVSDTSQENTQRYLDYLQRAVFYNVTGTTLDGLLGQIFRKETQKEVPSDLEIMFEDVDGSGIGLDQFAKKCCAEVLMGGRAGVLVDYPQTDGPASRADLESGNIRPTMRLYRSRDIINWQLEDFGAKKKFTLLVLKETSETLKTDGFETEYNDLWRVLRLEDGVYTQEIYTEKNSQMFVTDKVIVRGANGAPLDEIQFEIIGVRNNDVAPVKPPLYDIAALNIAHYRNSADYEESSFICGQPTPYFSGLTEEWVKDVLKGEIQLGSRAAVPLPMDGTAGLIQAAPNMVPFEAMQHKERQMIALGAKLIQDKQVQRSATEAGIEASSEASILQSIAQNVSIALQDGLKRACLFVGTNPEGIIYRLNTEFDLSTLNPQKIAEILKLWQAGAITFEEMRKTMKDAGIAYLEDEEAKEKIDEEKVLTEDEEDGTDNNSTDGENEPV